VSFSASAFASGKFKAQAIGGGLRFGVVQAQANEYFEQFGRVFSVNATERMWRKWSVSEYLTEQHGHAAFNFGGGYSGNTLSANLSWQEFFMPATGRFEKAMTVQISLQLPHSVSVNAGTFVQPNGQVKWSAYGGEYVPLGFLPVTVPGQRNQAVPTGKFKIEGSVVDASGEPLEGACISVGGQTVFSNSSGEFSARFKKDASVAILVLPWEFSASGNWEVVSSSAVAKPGERVQIVVRRKSKA
jgi:hypothetical protein